MKVDHVGGHEPLQVGLQGANRRRVVAGVDGHPLPRKRPPIRLGARGKDLHLEIARLQVGLPVEDPDPHPDVAVRRRGDEDGPEFLTRGRRIPRGCLHPAEGPGKAGDVPEMGQEAKAFAHGGSLGLGHWEPILRDPRRAPQQSARGRGIPPGPIPRPLCSRP